MKALRITASALILRSEPRQAPETDTGIRIRPGDAVTGYGLSYDGAWTAVKVGGATGWAGTSFLTDAPAAPGTATTTPSAAPRWRTAKALTKLLAQVNAAAPGRKKQHDGTIGDPAHAARSSDHNPNAQGVVTALDITHDSNAGCDCRKIAEAMAQSRDPRIKYLIFQGRILSSLRQPWVWRPYTGANAHMQHLHVSVDADPRLYDDDGAWRIS